MMVIIAIIAIALTVPKDDPRTHAEEVRRRARTEAERFVYSGRAPRIYEGEPRNCSSHR
jgi:hypothetical protein